MITHLDRIIADSGPPPAEGAGPDHPMRVVTRQVAFEPGGWTPERRARVAALFDGLAPEWHTRNHPGRDAPLLDALDRGVGASIAMPSTATTTCLELGSGTGVTTASLAERFERVVALDLALEMLRLAPADAAPRVQADAADLPFAEGSADVVVLVNTLLFPAEIDRVLAPEGRLVWVNTRGPLTPIHLSAEDVIAALDGTGTWNALASEAGPGTWCVAWRGEPQA